MSLQGTNLEEFLHTTVLLEETVDGCLTNPDGVYVDGTFGRGGHSRLLLSKLSDKGRLIGFDKDPLAIQSGKELEQEDNRFQIVQSSFAEMKTELARLGISEVDGILLDLGVSSPQLDDAERGFSFLRDGPLDMRMNPDAGLSAAEWLEQTPEKEIARVLKEYGEERYGKRIANWLKKAQAEEPITTTLRLAEIVKAANPNWERHKHPATRAFQAIRIAVNNELGDLENVLDESVDLLAAGGHLAVISFHSLEDRMVKRFIRAQEKGKDVPVGIPLTDDQLGKTMKRVGKAIMPTEEEVKRNARSRSAVLRVAERLA